MGKGRGLRMVKWGGLRMDKGGRLRVGKRRGRVKGARLVVGKEWIQGRVKGWEKERKG